MNVIVFTWWWPHVVETCSSNTFYANKYCVTTEKLNYSINPFPRLAKICLNWIGDGSLNNNSWAKTIVQAVPRLSMVKACREFRIRVMFSFYPLPVVLFLLFKSMIHTKNYRRMIGFSGRGSYQADICATVERESYPYNNKASWQ
jgi:hypothetical protein